jgi:hypothetical protein
MAACHEARAAAYGSINGNVPLPMAANRKTQAADLHPGHGCTLSSMTAGRETRAAEAATASVARPIRS